MRKALISILLAGMLLGPGSCMVAIALVANPAAQAACAPSGPVVGSVPASLTAATTAGTTITLDDTQLTRAATIIDVGTGIKGVGQDGIIVALMAALTESSLRLLFNKTAVPASAAYPNDGDGGDHDSLGLFQMRPSTGWGTVTDLMDAEYEAAAFYGGPRGPNHSSPRGLLDIADWQALPKGTAAQAVEVSAFPDRYAAYEPVATAILDALAASMSSSSCDNNGDGPGSAVPLAPGFAGALIAAAQRQIGKPYVWGGGTYSGPSGRGSDGRGPGFDCSGLVLYAAYQATNGSLRLPHYSGAQITFGRGIAWDAKQPGDLIFFTHPGSSAPHHVAIYVGGDRILQAPHTGDDVRFGTVGEFTGETMTVRRLG